MPVASVLCAGCGKDRISKKGLYQSGTGALLCERCYETPPEVVKLARRARLYRGLETWAAAELGVTPHYVSQVLNLKRIRNRGDVGHARLFLHTAALVRRIEGQVSTISKLLRVNPVPLRGEALPEMVALVFVHRRGAACQFFAYGEAAELRRRLRAFVEGRRPPARLDVELLELPGWEWNLPPDIVSVALGWRASSVRPSLVFSAERDLPALVGALDDLLEDLPTLAQVLERARPMTELSRSDA